MQWSAACEQCRLTRRSRRGPTASHQARAGGTRTFSPARAWRLAVGPASTPTLGRTKCKYTRSPRQTHLRGRQERAKRSHRGWLQPGSMAKAKLSAQVIHLRPVETQSLRRRPQITRSPLCHIAPADCVGVIGFQSDRRAAARSLGTSSVALPRWLEYVARHRRQRGAGSFWSEPRGTTKPWQAIASAHRARPNPSVEARPNGRPPGPGWWYAVHFHQPGPGVLPSVPPHLKR